MLRYLPTLLALFVASAMALPETSADTILTREGIVVSSEVQSIASPVSSSVKKIAAAGSQIKKGDLLIAFDDTSLNSSLEKQEQAATTAAASLTRAKRKLDSLITEQTLDVEIADREITLAELKKQRTLGPDGEHQQAIEEAQASVARANLALQLAEVRYRPYRDNPSRSSDEARLAAELSVATAKNDVLQASRRLSSLTGHDAKSLEATLELSILKSKMRRLKILREHLAIKLDAEKNLDTRKRALASITRRLQQLEESVAQCQIFAPFDGVVQAANNTTHTPELGSFIRKDSPIMTFVRTDSMAIELRIPESDVARINVGQDVNIRPGDALPRPIRGRVARIYRISAGDLERSGNEDYKVQISVENPPPSLRLGMKVQADIEAAR